MRCYTKWEGMIKMTKPVINICLAELLGKIDKKSIPIIKEFGVNWVELYF